MPRIYRDDDVDVSVLYERTIGVIGYGNQGRAQAMNIRDSGCDPEIVATELHLSGEFVEIAKAMITHGFFGQLKLHSQTSQYGQLSRLDRMAPPELLARVDEAIQGIISGRFHTEWAKEQQAGKPNMTRLWLQALEHPLAKSEAKLEALRQIVARSYDTTSD